MKAFPEYQRHVHFADTDMAGIVHFSTILRYVEEAEHFALRELGVEPVSASGGFPKVHVDCDYRSPLKFGDVISVQMRLENVGRSSLKWSFAVRVGSEIAAEGSIVTVYVGAAGGATSIPESVIAALSATS